MLNLFKKNETFVERHLRQKYANVRGHFTITFVPSFLSYQIHCGESTRLLCTYNLLVCVPQLLTHCLPDFAITPPHCIMNSITNSPVVIKANNVKQIQLFDQRLGATRNFNFVNVIQNQNDNKNQMTMQSRQHYIYFPR